MTTPAPLVDLLLSYSEEFYSDPYPTLALLRREAPVFWSEKGNHSKSH
jgi:hypothetical protein